MKRLICLGLLTLAACSEPAPAPLGVDGAWVRLAAVPGRPAAAYFTLHGGPASARLVAVDGAHVAAIELHANMKGHAGMMAMTPLAGVDVPAGGTARFAPGGNHAMLFGVPPAIKPGDLLPLGFRFADGRRLVASAKVVAAGDAAP